MTVYKYTLPLDDFPTLALPCGATILHVAEQHGALCLWARVNPDAPTTLRQFRVAGTGHPEVPDWPHVGSVLLHGGRLVVHVFAEPE